MLPLVESRLCLYTISLKSLQMSFAARFIERAARSWRADSQNVTRSSVLLIKHSGDHLKGMRWAEHVAGMENEHTGFRCGGLRERDHLISIGVDERIILKWLLKK